MTDGDHFYRPGKMVYRVQDATGRGPWRPGFSTRWLELDAPVGRLTETIMDLVDLRALPSGFHYGCACRSLTSLLEWFLPAERARLHAFKFFPVKLQIDHIVAESSSQLLIARVRPFAEGASRVNWPKVAGRV